LRFYEFICGGGLDGDSQMLEAINNYLILLGRLSHDTYNAKVQIEKVFFMGKMNEGMMKVDVFLA
jgi:hypothetical protein